MTAVRCYLYRGREQVETWVIARLPVDPGAANRLLRRSRDQAIGADTRPHRCDVHDEATGEFLYALEEAP